MKKIFFILLCIFAFETAIFCQDTIPNSGLEHWKFMGWFENPDGWTTNNNQLMDFVVKDIDAFSGNYAMKVKSNGYARSIFAAKNYPEFIKGGMFFKARCHMEKPDTVNMEVWQHANGIRADSSTLKFIDSVTDYETQIIFFKKKLYYTMDTIEIIIKGGKDQATTVTIDCLNYFWMSTIGKPIDSGKYWNILPQAEGISMVPQKPYNALFGITVFNLSGQNVYTTLSYPSPLFIPLKPGLYFYRITLNNFNVQNGKVMVN
jgi:hypothetical protein